MADRPYNRPCARVSGWLGSALSTISGPGQPPSSGSPAISPPARMYSVVVFRWRVGPGGHIAGRADFAGYRTEPHMAISTTGTSLLHHVMRPAITTRGAIQSGAPWHRIHPTRYTPAGLGEVAGPVKLRCQHALPRTRPHPPSLHRSVSAEYGAAPLCRRF